MKVKTMFMMKIKFPLRKNFYGKSYIKFDVPVETNAEKKKSRLLKIDSGHLYNISGLNGVGKSTLLNILSLLTDFNGPYDFDDDSMLINLGNDSNSKDKIRYNRFSYIFQDPHIINMYTVSENLEIVNPQFKFESDMQFIIDRIDEKVNSKVKNYLIKKVIDLKRNDMNSPYSLSGGEKQLLSFIRAMIKPSNIIFADEPWASMDQNLKEFVEEQLYLYLNNEDLFSKFRESFSYKTNNTVMIITHAHQHNKNNLFGKHDKSWSKIIPVINHNLKANKKNNHSQLRVERYSIKKSEELT